MAASTLTMLVTPFSSAEAAKSQLDRFLKPGIRGHTSTPRQSFCSGNDRLRDRPVCLCHSVSVTGEHTQNKETQTRTRHSINSADF